MSTRDIHVQHLVKHYKEVKAVDDLSFHVQSGEIYGLLGPNGAGKSTAVRILTTLAVPDSGSACVGGYDVLSQPGQVRGIAGVALQDIGLDPVMTSLELLRLQGQLFGASRKQASARADELIELVGLSDAVGRRIRTYSGGMRRRLDLALALVHQPEILFLDEPTTGLDPASRRGLWAEVRRLNQELGMTILLTTQYLEEADALADRVGIIDRGSLQIEGRPSELKTALGSESINITFAGPGEAEQARSGLAELASETRIDRETVRLYLARAATAVPAVVQRLQAADLKPGAITLTQPTLDDVFLQVTGQRLRS